MQLMMSDGEASGTMPLLQQLTKGEFFESLKNFDARFLYANICNDVKVTYGTAALTMRNPYSGVPVNELRKRCHPSYPMVIKNSASESASDVQGGIDLEEDHNDENEGGIRNINQPLAGTQTKLVRGVAPASLSISHSAKVTAKLAGLSSQICEVLNKVRTKISFLLLSAG